jgi:pimeloyl-ACP methyl ester carboxylesterase
MADSDNYAPKTTRRTTEKRIRGADYVLNEWGDHDAPLLVYLHGWGDCGATFQFVVDAFVQDWHVVAPDWRGFGASRVGTDAYWFPDYLADLDEILAIVSPEQPVAVVGHSMGANVAGLYAGSLPERIAAFVNVEGFGLRDSDPSDAPQRYRAWLEAGRAVPEFSDYADFDVLAQRVMKRSPMTGMARARFVARAWASERNGRVALKADSRHKLPNPVLYRRAEAEACWERIEAPTLLVSGANSPFGDAPMSVPHATSATIPEAGHMMHFETPGALAALIEGFLAKHL